MKERALQLLRHAVGFPCFANRGPCGEYLGEAGDCDEPHVVRPKITLPRWRAEPDATCAGSLIPTPTRRQRRTARISARDVARLVRAGATATARAAKRPVRFLARRDSTAQVHVAVDVLALLTPLPFAIRAPGGEYQAETGDRAERA
jgi:hypothetical protein